VAGVTFGNTAGRKCIEHFLRQHQNAQRIGDVFTTFAHALADLSMLEAKINGSF